MTTYKCFDCGKIIKEEYIRKRVRCPYCGSKIVYKPRVVNTKVKAV
ncbi:MAG: DNA-directed RNA polymerase subunit P [Nanoarchaeota archaeon]|nr:DNA-directed RNA polymerase subunit P [Nanoarchaeota archaeon]MBU1445565.1 DNA-directed RNA polymerase subunit P [Nanoarchaeota archaeon]MBU2406389.1 DNA-directed RNA polymerase subunit P [Nanoarchaeota archaeon]MBU2420754.1 DNA-directed RNA polymerase subunit P [Nanoarchaeota archaeon]MBU2475454.1 DNA-directed RNA polymerase subunit P [Nanoarchaeota archaeon]